MFQRAEEHRQQLKEISDKRRTDKCGYNRICSYLSRVVTRQVKLAQEKATKKDSAG